MIGNLFKFRIPTILGLSVIVFGLVTGIYLTLQNQIILTKAAPETNPKNITVSNIEDTSVTISWETNQKDKGLVKYGISSTDENSALSETGNIHYVEISNLTPKTTYRYIIVSGKTKTNPGEFTTLSPLTPNTLKPLTGSVLDGNQPVQEGLVYLKVSDKILSATVKALGNFIIPLTSLGTTDVTVGNLEIISQDGKKATATVNLVNDGPIGPLYLGQNLDLTKQIIRQTVQNQFDLNGDGVVNTSDYSLLLKNFSKNPKEKKFDLNLDGVVDKKDADLLLEEIRKSGNH